METIIKLSRDQAELASEFAKELADTINNAALKKSPLMVALSGGSTPKMLFSVLGEHYSDKISWDYVHFFWGDERCVAPYDPDSNFGMTSKLLFSKISISASNIHRIKGESDPEKEIKRYSSEISNYCRIRNNLPVFDIIILGLGEDGHTSSIFPGNEKSFSTRNICEIAEHPVSGQKRVTLTGSVINNADNVIFLVTGLSKADIVAQVIENPGISEYPAANVEPENGVLKWYLDTDAASLLCQSA